MSIRAQPLLDFLEAKKTIEQTKGQVGNAIRDMRRSAGMTQSFLAASAGVPQAYLSMIESGKRTPSAESLERIMRAVSEGRTDGDSREDEEDQG